MPQHRDTLIVALSAAAFLAVAQPFRAPPVAAQGGSSQQPVFRSSVDLVTVDVAVLDDQGVPVDSLRADHFEVTVDGSPRRIVWTEFVPHRTTPLASATAADHFSTNEGRLPGRLVLVAVDQMHIRRVEGLAALRAASNFIDALDPADRVAATSVSHAGAIQFTTEHAVAKRQLQRLAGVSSAMSLPFQMGLSEALAIADGSRTRLDQVVLRECGARLGHYENLRRMAEDEGIRDPCPIQVEQQGRGIAQQARTDARLTLEAMLRLVQRLGELEGHKTLVLLSEGLVAEPQLIDLTSLGAAAQAARVTIHVLQLETPILDASSDAVSPTLYADLQLRADGLARIAGSARGSLFRLVGDDPYPFRRILKELSGHYLLAFEATPSDRDGRTHHIGVKVRAHGVTVRARPAFQFARASSAVAPDTELVRLLREPRLAVELPMRIAAYTFRDHHPDRLHILLSAESDSGADRQEVTAGFVLIDSRGIIADSGGGLMRNGRYFQSASVAPGRYTLRAAAVTGSGRRGSVERQLDAKLAESGSVKLSDFMLAEPPAGPSDPLRPLILRAAADRLLAYIEAYASDGWASQDAHAVYEVTPEAGPAPLPVLSVPAAFRPISSGRWVASADLPLRALDAGVYVATLRLALPGSPAQTFTRRFVVE